MTTTAPDASPEPSPLTPTATGGPAAPPAADALRTMSASPPHPAGVRSTCRAPAPPSAGAAGVAGFPPCSVPRVRRLGAGPSPPPRRPPPPAPVPTLEPVDPDAARAIGATVRTALEVLDGRRPPGQLDTLFDPGPLRYWRAEAGRRRTTTPARLLRTRLCPAGPGSVELAAACAVDGRVRALAARFDRHPSGWRCSVVRLL